MNIKIIVCVAVMLLLPVVSGAQSTVEVSIQGKVGDFSTLSRDYEIDGEIYDFPKTIILVNTAGGKLPFDRIRSGSVIKVIGEKTIVGAQSGTIKWKKIILIKE